MKNISQKLNLRWMSGCNLSDNQHFTTLNSIGKCLTYPLFLLLIALAVCGCQKDQEPIVSETNAQLSSPAPAAGADSLKSVLEGVSQWHVMAINKVVSSFSINLSTAGTTVCFANSKVTFSVPYNVFTFNPDSEPTTEYEQHGPYPVSYLSSNTLSIADEQFRVSAMANGGYALIAEDLTIFLGVTTD